MLPDDENPSGPAAAPGNTPASAEQEFGKRISRLLKTAEPDQAKLLDLLFNHLRDDVQLSRVVLMLLSPDRTRLGTRAGRGLGEHSLLRNLVIDIRKDNLLKSLLKKPRALWIDDENYKNYEAGLPAKFKTSFLQKNFFLMPLLIANSPIGIIICDRGEADTRLDKLSYIKFKSAITLTSEALAYLAKRNRQT